MSLNIAVVSDADSWMGRYIAETAERWRAARHLVRILSAPDHDSADIAFFLGYSRIVGAPALARARSNIVVHGSALPEGKGWSPWSWQILEGRGTLCLTLFEAVEGVDSGPIYDQRYVDFEGHELVTEWREAQARATLAMCDDFIAAFPEVLDRGRPQTGAETFYRRRRPDDSRVDPQLSLAAQFDLLRIVDNDRYPAYFEHRGHVYELIIRKRKASGK